VYQNSFLSYLRQVSGLIFFLALVAGCYDPPPPARVFIPGPDANVAITIAASATSAVVDEPIILFASRRTSGFVETPYTDRPDGVQWWRQMPPAYEKEVAANLKWIVKPEGKAKFNTNFRKDLTREVRFSEPGTYEILGISAGHGPEPVSSKSVTIKVVE